jgi:hypothetical protein
MCTAFISLCLHYLIVVNLSHFSLCSSFLFLLALNIYTFFLTGRNRMNMHFTDAGSHLSNLFSMNSIQIYKSFVCCRSIITLCTLCLHTSSVQEFSLKVFASLSVRKEIHFATDELECGTRDTALLSVVLRGKSSLLIHPPPQPCRNLSTADQCRIMWWILSALNIQNTSILQHKCLLITSDKIRHKLRWMQDFISNL